MDSETEKLVAHLFRHQSGRIVATLSRVFGARHLDFAEDVVQDALVKALQQWPFKGIPENPAGWLTLVAKNRALDLLRRDATLAHKITELEKLAAKPPQTETGLDDQLALILMCCHPSLVIEQQVALTLKMACGFSTSEIARAFLTPETTIAQRLVRAKRHIREQQISIEPPTEDDLAERLDSVLRVIYLMFNEGYSASHGDDLVRSDLCDEAIRLGNLLLAPLTPRQLQTPVVHALLALMLLQAARLPARTNNDGCLVLFQDQDRSLWDRKLIALGMRHLGWSAAGDSLSTYHLQAEIAAIHAQPFETDWQRIATLYDELYASEPTPIVALNGAIARARWLGPAAGLRALDEIASHPALRSYHLLPAVRAELLKQLGDLPAAVEAYEAALNCQCTAPERRFLESQLAAIR